MDIQRFLEDNSISYKSNVLLSSLTGMSLNGHISLIAYPDSVERLKILFCYVLRNQFTYEIIGCLTNTYLCEGFNRDIVISTCMVKEITQTENSVVVGCGCGLSALARKLTLEGYNHYTGLVGIPGTIGAATINNSGAFGDSMEAVVESVTIIDSKGTEVVYSVDALKYSPRYSSLKNQKFGVLLYVTLRLDKVENPQDIIEKMNNNQIIRKQLIDGKRKSLGSIIAGYSIQNLWKEHPIANVVKKVLYAPFRGTKYWKKAQCVAEFLVLGNLRFIKHCDNIGRFCWSKETQEKDFKDYLAFIETKSNGKIDLEIEIKS